MKITTKAVGIAVLIAFSSIGPYYGIKGGIPEDSLFWFILVLLSSCSAILSFIAFVGWSISEDKTIVELPPFLANYRASIREKKELNKAISKKYIAMAKAEEWQLDRLQSEVKVLEERLERI